jgi:hypothetical protein
VSTLRSSFWACAIVGLLDERDRFRIASVTERRGTALDIREGLDRVEGAVGGALLRGHHVGLRAEVGEVDRLAEVHVDGLVLPLGQVLLPLAGDALAHAEHEHRNDVRARRAERDATDAGLRGKELVGVVTLVARSLGMDPEHGADVRAVELLDAARDRVGVEALLLFLAHDRREHPHAAHREVHGRPERVRVEELLADWKEDPLRQPRAPVEERGDGEEVEERAVVRDEKDRVLLSERREILEPVDDQPAARAAVDERAHHDAVPVRRQRGQPR